MIKEYKTRASKPGTGSAWTRCDSRFKNQHVPLPPELIHDLDQIFHLHNCSMRQTCQWSLPSLHPKMDIKGSETHLLLGWGGCRVKTPTEKYKTNPRLLQTGGTQSVAEIRSYPLNIIFTEASDVPDMEGNATAALTFHTVDLSGSQMRKNSSGYSCSASRAPLRLCCVTQCMHATTPNKVFWKYIGCLWYKSILFISDTFVCSSRIFFLSTGPLYPRMNIILVWDSIFYGRSVDMVLSLCLIAGDEVITKVYFS